MQVYISEIIELVNPSLTADSYRLLQTPPALGKSNHGYAQHPT